jgi:hypothetical protein
MNSVQVHHLDPQGHVRHEDLHKEPGAGPQAIQHLVGGGWKRVQKTV